MSRYKHHALHAWSTTENGWIVKDEKKCIKCLTWRPLDLFYKSKTSIGGYKNRCRVCTRQQANEWRAANPHRCNLVLGKRRGPQGKGFPEGVLIDDDVREAFKHFSYCRRSDDYISRAAALDNGRTHTQHLARDVLGMAFDDPRCADHINGNPLDNRRANLRILDRKGNGQNRRLSSDNTSGYMGVSWMKTNAKWVAYGSLNNKKKYLGSFTDRHEAGRVAHEFRTLHYQAYTGRCFEVQLEN